MPNENSHLTEHNLPENSLLEQLIDALRALPGVGPKSARRMAFHLLLHNRQGGLTLARLLAETISRIGHCQQCRNLTARDLCAICAQPDRDRSQLCVVEGAADAEAIEKATGYRGLYFVLMGHLSPIDGIGPEQLGIAQLLPRFASGEIREVIIATNPTVEGNATGHYIAELARQQGIPSTRLAQGVPVGGELEFIDAGTLRHAFGGRTSV